HLQAGGVPPGAPAQDEGKEGVGGHPGLIQRLPEGHLHQVGLELGGPPDGEPHTGSELLPDKGGAGASRGSRRGVQRRHTPFEAGGRPLAPLAWRKRRRSAALSAAAASNEERTKGPEAT